MTNENGRKVRRVVSRTLRSAKRSRRQVAARRKESPHVGKKRIKWYLALLIRSPILLTMCRDLAPAERLHAFVFSVVWMDAVRLVLKLRNKVRLCRIPSGTLMETYRAWICRARQYGAAHVHSSVLSAKSNADWYPDNHAGAESDFPRFWRLFGYLMSWKTRDTIYTPLIAELQLDFEEVQADYVSPVTRRWLKFCFGLRTILVIVRCLDYSIRDGALQFIARLFPPAWREQLRLWFRTR